MTTPRVAAATLIALALAAAATAQTPSPGHALARDILKQLVEIPTVTADGITPRAAQAMADRLIASGIPTDDVHVFGPDAKTGVLVARLRGNGTGGRPILLMAHLDVVPRTRPRRRARPCRGRARRPDRRQGRAVDFWYRLIKALA